ncbi:MAG: metallophosphoesterase [Clostridia bacterium]|nr:metallophosphoesterase [Clostridia bacterium]
MIAAGKKKLIIWIVVGVFIAAVIGVSAYLMYAFLPRSMDIDWDSIEKSNTGVTLLAANDEHNDTGSPALVKLDANGSVASSEWKVLQFTDMHLSHEMKTTNDTIAHFIDTLNKEKPDFVVLTGDIVTRLGAKVRLEQLSEIFEKAEIYWAYVLGNHEGDSDPYTVSRENTMKIVSEYDHCLADTTVKKTKAGEDVWGYCNFVVNLLGEDFGIVQTMIFLDSGNEITDEDAEKFDVRDGCYDYIKESQMKWYEEKIADATTLNADVKAMLFMHIPLVEYRNLLLVELADVESGKVVLLADHPDYLEKADASTKEKIKNGKIKVISSDYKKIDGSDVIVNGEKVGYFVLREGWKVIGDTRSFERACSSDHNNGMYARLVAISDHVNGLFCGHDHINNTILYEEDAKVYLCYGTCSGIQGYSKAANGLSDGDKYEDRGYSVIDIHQNGTFDFSDVLFETNGAHIARIVNSQPVVG